MYKGWQTLLRSGDIRQRIELTPDAAGLTDQQLPSLVDSEPADKDAKNQQEKEDGVKTEAPKSPESKQPGVAACQAPEAAAAAAVAPAPADDKQEAPAPTPKACWPERQASKSKASKVTVIDLDADSGSEAELFGDPGPSPVPGPGPGPSVVKTEESGDVEPELDIEQALEKMMEKEFEEMEKKGLAGTPEPHGSSQDLGASAEEKGSDGEPSAPVTLDDGNAPQAPIDPVSTAAAAEPTVPTQVTQVSSTSAEGPGHPSADSADGAPAPWARWS